MINESDARDFIDYHAEIHGTDVQHWTSGPISETYDVVAMYIGDHATYADVARLAFLVRQEAKEMSGVNDEDSRYWAMPADPDMPEHPRGKWGLVDDEEGITAWFDTAKEAWGAAEALEKTEKESK